jgi:hypothetical protein
MPARLRDPLPNVSVKSFFFSSEARPPQIIIYSGISRYVSFVMHPDKRYVCTLSIPNYKSFLVFLDK